MDMRFAGGEKKGAGEENDSLISIREHEDPSEETIRHRPLSKRKKIITAQLIFFLVALAMTLLVVFFQDRNFLIVYAVFLPVSCIAYRFLCHSANQKQPIELDERYAPFTKKEISRLFNLECYLAVLTIKMKGHRKRYVTQNAAVLFLNNKPFEERLQELKQYMDILAGASITLGSIHGTPLREKIGLFSNENTLRLGRELLGQLYRDEIVCEREVDLWDIRHQLNILEGELETLCLGEGGIIQNDQWILSLPLADIEDDVIEIKREGVMTHPLTILDHFFIVEKSEIKENVPTIALFYNETHFWNQVLIESEDYQKGVGDIPCVRFPVPYDDPFFGDSSLKYSHKNFAMFFRWKLDQMRLNRNAFELLYVDKQYQTLSLEERRHLVFRLSESRGVKRVYLNSTQIGEEEIKALEQKLPSNSSIVEFTCPRPRCASPKIEAICERNQLLRQRNLPARELLELDMNLLGEEDMLLLMQKKTSLKALDLSNSPFSSKLSRLVEVIPWQTHGQELNLSGVLFDFAFLKKLCDLFSQKEYMALRVLRLAGVENKELVLSSTEKNDGSSTRSILGHWLSKDKNLTELDLSQNKLPFVFLLDFLGNIVGNTQLKRFIFAGNKTIIKEDEFDPLKKCYLKLATLLQIDISQNYVEEKLEDFFEPSFMEIKEEKKEEKEEKEGKKHEREAKQSDGERYSSNMYRFFVSVPRTIKSFFNPDREMSVENWLVFLACSKKFASLNSEHTFILIEGIRPSGQLVTKWYHLTARKKPCSEEGSGEVVISEKALGEAKGFFDPKKFSPAKFYLQTLPIQRKTQGEPLLASLVREEKCVYEYSALLRRRNEAFGYDPEEKRVDCLKWALGILWKHGIPARPSAIGLPSDAAKNEPLSPEEFEKVRHTIVLSPK